MDKNTYLTPSEVAKALNVAPVTLRKWAQKQMLNAIATPGGHRRYSTEEVKNFAKKYGLPLCQDVDADEEKLRILIVDDEQQLAEFLVELFSGFPEDIVCDYALGGFEAGHKIHTFKPDVVLLDIMMPDIDGFDVCRLIKSHSSIQNIRVIAMTGFYTEERQREIIEIGAETCLAKPLDIDRLLKIVGVERDSRKSVGAKLAV